MTPPVISIITASLNHASRLLECLRSVRHQTFLPLEHIVIDGGSSDETLPILQKNQHTRLSWISEPDSGIAEAMNKGIVRARGEWLLFLQADDFLMAPDSLDLLAEALDTPGPGIVSANVEMLGGHRRPRTARARGWSLKTYFKTTIPHQGAFIRRRLFDELGRYDESFAICMDYEWFLRAFRYGVSARAVPITVSAMSDTGISSRKDWPSLARRFSEEKRAQFKNAPSTHWRLLYRLYWMMYPQYRKTRWLLSRHAREVPA